MLAGMLMTDLVWNSEAQSVGVQIIIITFNILIITDILIVETELSKQILKIKQKIVKNPNWGEADQSAIYKGWRSLIWDHQTKCIQQQ